MLRLTLAARITMIVIVGLTAVWVAAIAAFYRSHAVELKGVRPLPERIAALAQLIESASPAQRPLILDAATTETFQPTLRASRDTGSQIANRAVTGRALHDYTQALDGRPFTLTASPPPALVRWFPRLAMAGADELEFRIALRTGDTLVIETHNPIVLNRSGVPVGFGAGLFGTLVAVAALLIMQRETKPLARLAAAVDRVDLSSDPAPLPEARRSAPEIRALVAAFNRLQTRLGAMLRARMGLIGGISHDVRTFATRLRLRIDAIPEARERQRAVADIEDMIRLLDDALLATRAGAGGHAREMVEFAALVASEVEDRRRDGAVVNLITNPATQRAVVLGDRLALRRVVANLCDNAIKYGRAAHLSLNQDERHVILTVEDEGPGIPVEQREAMLEPFTRLEQSRNRDTGGAGLGLAIVRALTDAHGGNIEIGEALRGGCRVTVVLPLFTGH